MIQVTLVTRQLGKNKKDTKYVGNNSDFWGYVTILYPLQVFLCMYLGVCVFGCVFWCIFIGYIIQNK